MQYPVPQFTDVEDKIIGPLTLVQFGVLFGTGLFVFLVYTATKNLPITIFFVLVFGLPALGVAFGKLNGRPLYKSLPKIVSFILSPKVMLFHKENPSVAASGKIKDADIQIVKKQEPAEVAGGPAKSNQDRLREINRALQRQAAAERELVKQSRR